MPAPFQALPALLSLCISEVEEVEVEVEAEVETGLGAEDVGAAFGSMRLGLMSPRSSFSFSESSLLKYVVLRPSEVRYCTKYFNSFECSEKIESNAMSVARELIDIQRAVFKLAFVTL